MVEWHDVKAVAVEGIVGEFRNVPVHAPLLCQHIYEVLVVVSAVGLELCEQPLKERQPAVGQMYVAQLRFRHGGFLRCLLHYGGQLLVVADEHEPVYPAAVAFPGTEQSDEMRLENLRRLVHDGKTETLYL